LSVDPSACDAQATTMRCDDERHDAVELVVTRRVRQ
jgi:hypothetical protein